MRGIYEIDSPALALRYTLQLADDLGDESCPPEVNKLDRTIARWTPQITNWHISKVTNGPTEALNNLIKRIKRAAFGFRNFANYRIRALLYAGKPNWDLLAAVTPPYNPKSYITVVELVCKASLRECRNVGTGPSLKWLRQSVIPRACSLCIISRLLRSRGRSNSTELLKSPPIIQ